MGFTSALYSVTVYLVQGHYVRGLLLFEGCGVQLVIEGEAAGAHSRYSQFGIEVVICCLGGAYSRGGKSHAL